MSKSTLIAAVPGRMLALLVGSPTSDVELLALEAAKGQDLAALGVTADLLYLGTFVNEDADGNGIADHDSSWPGRVVNYLGGLDLAAGLVPLVQWSAFGYQLKTRITATSQDRRLFPMRRLFLDNNATQ